MPPLPLLTAAGRIDHGRKLRVRGLLVAVQVAISIVLLLGAGLYLRSTLAAWRHDPGFDLARSAIARVDLRLHGYDEVRGRAFMQRALAEAGRLPGVRRASLVDYFPLGFDGNGAGLVTENDLRGKPAKVYGRFSVVSPEFFEQFDIPIVGGRRLLDTDVAGAPLVAVVNERAARELWPGQNPIGKQLALRGEATGWREVVGVARDTDVRLFQKRSPFVFVPFHQEYSGDAMVAVESEAPEQLIAPLRAALRAIDPDVAVIEAGTVASSLGMLLLPLKLTAGVLLALGGVGLFLAILGLYSVVAYSVRRRTREIGIRMALGAESGQVRRMVLRQSLWMLLSGAVPGLVIAYLAAGLLRNLLFAIAPHDPLTFAAAPAVLIAVGLTATYFPARRAAGIDPNTALREL